MATSYNGETSAELPWSSELLPAMHTWLRLYFSATRRAATGRHNHPNHVDRRTCTGISNATTNAGQSSHHELPAPGLTLRIGH